MVSTEFSTSIVLLLQAFVLAPFAWLAWHPGGAKSGPVLALVAIGLAVFSTGTFQRGVLANTDVEGLVTADVTGVQCKQVLTVLRDAGVLLEAPKPSGLTVQRDQWEKLPEPIRAAVLDCAVQLVSPDGRIETIPVILR
jgi:hypothetical protein